MEAKRTDKTEKAYLTGHAGSSSGRDGRAWQHDRIGQRSAAADASAAGNVVHQVIVDQSTVTLN